MKSSFNMLCGEYATSMEPFCLGLLDLGANLWTTFLQLWLENQWAWAVLDEDFQAASEVSLCQQANARALQPFQLPLCILKIRLVADG